MTEKDLLTTCKPIKVYGWPCYMTPRGLVFQVSGFPKPKLVRVFEMTFKGKKFTHKHLCQGITDKSLGVSCYPTHPTEDNLKELNGLGILVKF